MTEHDLNVGTIYYYLMQQFSMDGRAHRQLNRVVRRKGYKFDGLGAATIIHQETGRTVQLFGDGTAATEFDEAVSDILRVLDIISVRLLKRRTFPFRTDSNQLQVVDDRSVLFARHYNTFVCEYQNMFGAALDLEGHRHLLLGDTDEETSDKAEAEAHAEQQQSENA